MTTHQEALTPDAAPVVAEILWTHREGQLLTGLMTFTDLNSADRARIGATGREDQWLITGGMHRTTLDGFNDYTTDVHRFDRYTPEQAARAAADWLGLSDRPTRARVVHEWADGA